MMIRFVERSRSLRGTIQPPRDTHALKNRSWEESILSWHPMMFLLSTKVKVTVVPVYAVASGNFKVSNVMFLFRE
ncbi:hypothetical protein WN55_05468 [Dufourea novaeangliae]|uniref:Uncharacterized protein n=1 Tax=Dufourea novaeangliae TaxID=178035 RepID=A0A154PMK2_DUFNO|nr:hypothetical protein WN55_05468 [Dufourea novaeangliae]